MDNARFHRMKVLQPLAQKFGYKILPLTPYSPELNPIEHTWAHLKKHIRTVLPHYCHFTDAIVSSYLVLLNNNTHISFQI